MAGQRTYPQFPAGIETRFSAVKMAAGDDASAYLDDPQCPYPSGVKAVLRAWLDPIGAAGRDANGNLGVTPIFQSDASGQTDEDRADLVLEEVQNTIDAMRAIEITLDAEDSEGKLNLLKAKTSLLDKWAQIKDRTTNLKQVGEFQRLVIQVLEEIGDKDIVASFKKRLAEISN